MVSNASVAASTMANQTLFDAALPPLPAYTLVPQTDFFSWISDFWLSLLAPVIVYWIASLFFHVIDICDLFPQYRLHTPEEITKRNRVTRWECFRDVIIQQIIQVSTGAILTLTDLPQMTGKQEYDVAVWATRVRLAQRAMPVVLGFLGLNATAISKDMSASHPFIAGALAGGYYPFLTSETSTPAFAAWEMMVAQFISNIVVPGLRFVVAIIFVDTWQYFLHRLMHINKWMYTHFHSRHHRLYVPYAYGALYNHPFEGFLLDTLGAGLAYKLAGLTLRQGTVFFCMSITKTVDDHCGYAFPFDPLQLVTNNNAAYHDIHHQNWGIKTNFSQPFFTFWDRFMGTKYVGPRENRLADRKRTTNAK